MTEIEIDLIMSRAIELAQKGLGHVHPNPPVGCIVLDKSGDILSEGYHHVFGEAHAEIDALNKIDDKSLLEGATFIVTLEPCAHEAKTPSCAKTLAELPIAKVIYGKQDPNPQVSGAGAKILQQAGIEAQLFQTQNEDIINDLEELAEIFFKNQIKNECFFSLKLASSLDGKMALSSGESFWITNEQSRDYVQFLRAQHDGILVGGRTVLADNPSLNIRWPKGAANENKLIVYDPNGSALRKISGTENIFKVRSVENIFWLVQEKVESVTVGVQQIVMEGSLGKQLFGLGLKAVFVEGGPYVINHFIEQKNCDRLHIFMAPFLMGPQARSWSQSPELTNLKERQSFKKLKIKQFGDDAYLTLR